MKIIYLDNNIISFMLEADRVGSLNPNMLGIEGRLAHQKSCYFRVNIIRLGYRSTSSYVYSSKNNQYISYATLLRQYLTSKL